MVRPLTNELFWNWIFCDISSGSRSRRSYCFISPAHPAAEPIFLAIDLVKKYTSYNIGTVLLVVDMAAVIMAFFVFGPETGLFSSLGLMAKSSWSSTM